MFLTSTEAAPRCGPADCARSPWLHVLPARAVCPCIGDSHSGRREGASPCGFYLDFSDIRDVERLFMCTGHVYVSLEKCLFRSPIHFLIGLLIYLFIYLGGVFGCMNF